MKTKSLLLGHFLAFFTILVWGTTLISTKILLADMSPLQIVVYRFAIGYIVLFLLHPRRAKSSGLREELLFLFAGLFGVTLYMFTQNIALTYTSASNVGLLLCVAPLFTAGLFHIFIKDEKVTAAYFVGFAVAITGIFLVIFNGSALELNPLGDVLAITAALCWAAYCVFLKKTLVFHYNTIVATRKIFFYGLMTMVPLIIFLRIPFAPHVFKSPTNLLNLLYLGVAASALCFITWGKASDLIGGVKTAAYIYLNPLVTIVTAYIVLHEKITLMSIIGFVLILIGLYISDKKYSIKKNKKMEGTT